MKKNPKFLILILGALTTVSPFSIDMYLPAFQQIAEQLNTSTARVSLSLSSYFIGLALGQVFYGPFLDRYGRKPPLYFGLAIYIFASVVCLFSHSIEALIVFRFFQAIGGCVAGVASMAMVRDFYPVEESARVFSKLMLILSVSPMLAPTVGSFITAALGWQAVFVSLALIVILVLLSVAFFLPEGHQADPTTLLDPRSIFKNFASISRNAQFSTYSISGAFSFAGLFGYLAGASPLFMGTFGVSARIFGGIFAFLSIGVTGGGQFNIFLSKWFSSQRIFNIAISTQLLIAFIFCIGSVANILGLYSHIAILFIYLACVGLTLPNATALALAPFEKNAGTAASLLGFQQMAVGALASAGFGILSYNPSTSISILLVVTSAIGFILFKLFSPKKLTVIDVNSQPMGH